MFGPNATIPHQGTYLTEIMALTGSILAFLALLPRLAVAMTGIQALLNITVSLSSWSGEHGEYTQSHVDWIKSGSAQVVPLIVRSSN